MSILAQYPLYVVTPPFFAFTISGFNLKIDIMQNSIKNYTDLANSGKTIILCWIPSHVNMRGNERADTAAKSALLLPVTNMMLPAMHFQV